MLLQAGDLGHAGGDEGGFGDELFLRQLAIAQRDLADVELHAARDESGELFQTIVHGFKARGVDFRVCNNTLVPSGIAEVGRLREKAGYAYLRM
jgi:intracellular sulfur oxidation DsrE/DsrF family protein